MEKGGSIDYGKLKHTRRPTSTRNVYEAKGHVSTFYRFPVTRLYITSFIRQKNGSKRKINERESGTYANSNHTWFQVISIE